MDCGTNQEIDSPGGTQDVQPEFQPPGNAITTPGYSDQEPNRAETLGTEIPRFKRNIFPSSNVQTLYPGKYEITWEIDRVIESQELKNLGGFQTESGAIQVHTIKVTPAVQSSIVRAVVEPETAGVTASVTWKVVAGILGLGGVFAVLREINKFFQTSFYNLLIGLGAFFTVALGLNTILGD